MLEKGNKTPVKSGLHSQREQQHSQLGGLSDHSTWLPVESFQLEQITDYVLEAFLFIYIFKYFPQFSTYPPARASY